MKKLQASIFIGVGTFIFCISYGQKNPAKGNSQLKLAATCLVSFAYESNKYLVSNIPGSIRDVPINPADASLPTSDGPIRDTGFKSRAFRYFVISLPLCVKFKYGKFSSALCAVINLNTIVQRTIVERNYTNYPGTSTRGVGAALTYYSVEECRVQYGPFAKISIGIFSVEFSLAYCSVLAVSGWNRYDALKRRKTYTLFHMNANIVKGMLCVGAWTIYGGYAVASSVNDTSYRGLVMTVPQHYILCSIMLNLGQLLQQSDRNS